MQKNSSFKLKNDKRLNVPKMLRSQRANTNHFNIYFSSTDNRAKIRKVILGNVYQFRGSNYIYDHYLKNNTNMYDQKSKNKGIDLRKVNLYVKQILQLDRVNQLNSTPINDQVIKRIDMIQNSFLINSIQSRFNPLKINLHKFSPEKQNL